MQGDLLVEGVALMLVGMGSVFAFLLILVFATMALGSVAQRFAMHWQTVADGGEGPSLEEAAAIAAALHRHRR
ncbi:MAG: oxaloacetate decarboxylase [Gammaproteobacteria bacterium]|nr:OadG family protein [Gammaproteobacteria bacterium]MXW51662.1 oxaloacetate decarboxylase [Gammaproteobacteria bacterium]MYE51345.1 oxaloacetate decarboxylase [Gammaproteobacteria bacterium]MYE85426.1 oxaloacetate decarboxylase [Gammaproteobacteria bacterium]MYF11643.1 oxaloacetate decarboxylase [Gammaproteobacteria bacterium]